jgi:hypothetical protein
MAAATQEILGYPDGNNGVCRCAQKRMIERVMETVFYIQFDIL